MPHSIYFDSLIDVNNYYSTVSHFKNTVFFHQNIRRANENFDLFLTYINCLEIKVFIIVLTEAWLKTPDEAAFYNISGYQLFAGYYEHNRVSGIMGYVQHSLSPLGGQSDLESAHLVPETDPSVNQNLRYSIFIDFMTVTLILLFKRYLIYWLILEKIIVYVWAISTRILWILRRESAYRGVSFNWAGLVLSRS